MSGQLQRWLWTCRDWCLGEETTANRHEFVERECPGCADEATCPGPVQYGLVPETVPIGAHREETDMSEAKQAYIVGVVVPARDADKNKDVAARDEVVALTPSVELLTPADAKPANILARDAVHKALKGIDREDVLVVLQAVTSSFPFA